VINLVGYGIGIEAITILKQKIINEGTYTLNLSIISIKKVGYAS